MFYNDEEPVEIEVAPDNQEPPKEEPASNIHYGNREVFDKSIVFLEGQSLRVDYFNKAVGQTDPNVSETDVGGGVLTQFIHIKGLDLRVTSFNQNNYDVTDSTHTITGEANVGPLFTPTSGDIFTFHGGTNYWLECEVTSVERMSYHRSSAYSIRYVVKRIHTTFDISHLLDKVINSYHYDADAVLRGETGLLTEYGKYVKEQKAELLNEVITWFHSLFYDEERFTYIHPDGYYDPHLVGFMTAFVDYPIPLKPPAKLDVRHQDFTRPYSTVFDCILGQAPKLLRFTAKAMTVYGAQAFDTTFSRFTVKGTAIRGVILPKRHLGKVLTDTSMLGGEEPYVFSESFYGDFREELDTKEGLVWKLMRKDEGVLYKDVIAVYKDEIELMDDADLFYWLPLTYLLLREAQ